MDRLSYDDLVAENARLRAQLDELARGGDPAADPVVKVVGDKAFGWLYVTHRPDGTQVVDHSGDIVDDPAELEQAAYDFVVNSRVSDHMHDKRPAGTLIESMVFTPEKTRLLGIPDGVVPTGWFGGFSFHDEQVLAKIKQGDRRAFSVGGIGKRTPVA